MKILVVSDTHGQNDNLLEVLEREKPFDIFVHCGDSGDLSDYIEQFVSGQVVMVRGNCDYDSFLRSEEYLEVCGHRIFITHGHNYDVTSGINLLANAAKDRGADVVLYGHTHIPEVNQLYGVSILNPGSLARPRQEGKRCTYGIITIRPDHSIYLETRFF